nr:hypothetical protein [Sinirhodobacter populi]
MIEPDHPDLSIGQQCKLLSIARSSFHYTPKGETEQNLKLMRQIDEQFLETPFLGVRQDDLAPTQRRPPRQREADTPADAPHGAHADLPETQRQQAIEGPQDLSISAKRSAGGSPEPSLVLGHHLPAHAAWVPLPRGDHGLAHPQGAVLEDLEHAGGRSSGNPCTGRLADPPHSVSRR